MAAALKAKRRAEEYKLEEQEKASRQLAEEQEARTPGPGPKSAAPKKERKKQSEGDRAGIKVSQVTGMHNARLINSPLDPSLISP